MSGLLLMGTIVVVAQLLFLAVFSARLLLWVLHVSQLAAQPTSSSPLAQDAPPQQCCGTVSEEIGQRVRIMLRGPAKLRALRSWSLGTVCGVRDQ